METLLAEPSFDTVSINFNLHDLLENATPPNKKEIIL